MSYTGVRTVYTWVYRLQCHFYTVSEAISNSIIRSWENNLKYLLLNIAFYFIYYFFISNILTKITNSLVALKKFLFLFLINLDKNSIEF